MCQRWSNAGRTHAQARQDCCEGRRREQPQKGCDLEIPFGKITDFTGVSASGKSSLVFDTIAAESQLNETFPTFVGNRLPHLGKPKVGGLYNLSASVVIDQCRFGGNARSAVDMMMVAAFSLQARRASLQTARAGPLPNIYGDGWQWADSFKTICVGRTTQRAPFGFDVVARRTHHSIVQYGLINQQPEQSSESLVWLSARWVPNKDLS